MDGVTNPLNSRRCEKKMKPKEKEELCNMLSSQYTVVSVRTETLATRAQALLGFGGIINAILVAIIIGVTNATTRAFLMGSPYFPLLQIAIIFGFIFYVASVIFSLLAYRTKKYMPVPQLGLKFVEAVISGKTKVDKEILSRQIAEAIEYHQGLNNKKYRWLLLGTLFLLIAIVFTAIIGIVLFLSIG
jgi:hypothetical protein